MKANILNIQKSSIHNGPGIRTVVFFKGCPLRCLWCSSPESQNRPTEILWDKKKCMYGRLCNIHCPTNSLTFQNNELIFNSSSCIGCHSCISQCPGKALEFAGNILDVDEVLSEILMDKESYEKSGGGVTLSGGEVLEQPSFALELLKKCKEHSIHTAIETSGYATSLIFSKICRYTDLLFFNIKHYDEREHVKYTGVSLGRILENLDFAIAFGIPVTARLPVIPNINNSLVDAAGMISLLQAHKVTSVNLLPFQQLGEKKYEELNLTYKFEGQKSLPPEELEDYFNLFKEAGLEVSL